jgi:N-acetyl-gamma-glutamyl-phosphate reductase
VSNAWLGFIFGSFTMLTNMNRIKAAIVGASGYSGEELIRLLYNHPESRITCVTSRQYVNQPVSTVFPRFADIKLTFSEPNADEIAKIADVVFLALPHGLATEFAVPLIDAGLKVIDISADFRIKNPLVYEKYYGKPHPAPELLERAVYGQPELNRANIQGASLIACPGCYPTSVIVPSAPLLRSGAIASNGLTVCSMSGVTGAGRKVDLPYIFPECNESVRPYAVTGHRHLPEIEQELSAAANNDVTINFIPHLVPVNRGIHTTIIAEAGKCIKSADDIRRAWNDAYEKERFVRVLAPGALADTKHVTWTNTVELGCAFDQRTNRVILSSAIDNLTKGAAGQAVQCMNIMFDCKETAGLT